MVKNLHLLSSGNAALADRCRDFEALMESLNQLASVADRRTAARAAALQSKLNDFAAKVILVGQVKAGKSALTNVLAGSPGLLPSDVNPWTSVVTNVHINNPLPQADGDAPIRSRFTFLNQEDWNALIKGGGRLGELANRAGASDEMQDIERQVMEMRAKTERRLGKHFEFLLGQTHDYGYVDTELVERYVSLGDDDEVTDDVSAATGRFADITKTAELFVDIPAYAMPMALCDTPGVNDTFMMREQITIRSLRGAELCVVVLAAHQALATVDVALLRILSNLEKRQIVLFINRIDELQDPASQIPEIQESITRTLKANRIENDVPIVFGSALWAEAALTGDMGRLPEDSLSVLEVYLGQLPDVEGLGVDEAVWRASGLSTLLHTLGERISEGSASHVYERLRRRTQNLANETRAVLNASMAGGNLKQSADLGGRNPADVINNIAVDQGRQLGELCDQLHQDLLARMERAQEDFVKRAADSLITYCERYGEQGTWTYDPAGLRMLHRSAYASFSRNLKSRAGKLFGDTTHEVEAVYRAVLGEELKDFNIQAPVPPRTPAPVGLGKTLALDLKGNWWRRWWQKHRGFEAMTNEYVELIRAETRLIIAELIQSQVPEVLEECRTAYNEFMHEQIEMIGRIAGQNSGAVTEFNPAKPPEQASDVCAGIIETLEKKIA